MSVRSLVAGLRRAVEAKRPDAGGFAVRVFGVPGGYRGDAAAELGLPLGLNGAFSVSVYIINHEIAAPVLLLR